MFSFLLRKHYFLLSESISSIAVKAGNAKTRVLLCREGEMKKIEEIRNVLGRVVDQRCVGYKGCDKESDKVFNMLVMSLHEDRL